MSADVMKNPPRDPKTPVITRKMIFKIALGALMMLYGTLSVFFAAVEQGDSTRATTVAFSTFVMFQMFNALNCRSATQSVFAIGFFSNKYFLMAIGGSIVMQLCVIYLPFLQYIFGTASLAAADLVSVVFIPLSIFVLDEILKHMRV